MASVIDLHLDVAEAMVSSGTAHERDLAKRAGQLQLVTTLRNLLRPLLPRYRLSSFTGKYFRRLFDQKLSLGVCVAYGQGLDGREHGGDRIWS